MVLCLRVPTYVPPRVQGINSRWHNHFYHFYVFIFVRLSVAMQKSSLWRGSSPEQLFFFTSLTLSCISLSHYNWLVMLISRWVIGDLVGPWKVHERFQVWDLVQHMKSADFMGRDKKKSPCLSPWSVGKNLALQNANRKIWHGCGSKCKVWIKTRSHKRSRPLIQTFPRELIQTIDPDLWNDIIYGRVDVWSNDGCMFFGFPALQIFTLPSCQANFQAALVVKPRC